MQCDFLNNKYPIFLVKGTSLSHASENFIFNLHSKVGQSRYKMSHQNIRLDAIENFYVYIVCVM